MAQLSRVDDNPNKVQEVEDKPLSLRQGADLIPAYISKYERVLYEARGQDWPDINKISIFRNGLGSTVRSRLSQQLNLPSRYPDFIRIVQQLAGRGSGVPSASSAPTPGRAPLRIQQRSQEQRSPDAMDINSFEVNLIKTLRRATASKGMRSISPAYRAQLRSLAKCVRCGARSHEAVQCPLPPIYQHNI